MWCHSFICRAFLPSLVCILLAEGKRAAIASSRVFSSHVSCLSCLILIPHVPYLMSHADLLAVQSASSESVALQTTHAFFYPIHGALFDQVDEEAELEYLPSVAGMPDLPAWMHYRHPNGSHEAFLYGTPTQDGELSIEVIALNKRTFDTYRRTIKFSVTERESKTMSHRCPIDSSQLIPSLQTRRLAKWN